MQVKYYINLTAVSLKDCILEGQRFVVMTRLPPPQYVSKRSLRGSRQSPLPAGDRLLQAKRSRTRLTLGGRGERDQLSCPRDHDTLAWVQSELGELL